MSNNKLKSKKESTVNESAESPSAITLVRDLRNGKISTSAMSKESRQTCVEYLGNEGCSAIETAEVLKVSTRTVHRDRDSIRAENAISKDPELVNQQVGQLVQHAEQAIQRLRKIAREKDCPAAARVDAVRGTWTVIKEMTELLQRLGYLPTAAQQVRADLTHHLDEPLSTDQMRSEAESLGLIIKQSGTEDKELCKQLAAFKTILKQLPGDEQIAKVTDKTKIKGKKDVKNRRLSR